MKNYKIIFFKKQNRGEENNRRRAHTFTQLIYIYIYIFIYFGVCTIRAIYKTVRAI